MSIKKIIIACIGTWLLSFSASAQFSAVGVRAGMGFARMADDLYMKSTLGYSFGGYVNYSISLGNSPLMEFDLQSGLFLVRKGAKMEKNDLISDITDIYHPWYLQIPILVTYKYHLPFKDEHYISISVGPAANIGLFGTYKHTVISPSLIGFFGPEMNSQTEQGAFNKMSRFDVSLIIGIGYQYREYTFDFYIDNGFIVPMKEVDAIYPERNSFSGSLQSFTFTLGYKLPLK